MTTLRCYGGDTCMTARRKGGALKEERYGARRYDVWRRADHILFKGYGGHDSNADRSRRPFLVVRGPSSVEEGS